MTPTLDDLMERASRALAEMDYLTCETFCLGAMDKAQQAEDWPGYARILLPLQEARRQRRMIACDAGVRINTRHLDPGVVVLTDPITREQASRFDQQARQARCYLEVLWVMDQTPEQWVVASHRGPHVQTQVPAAASPSVAWYLAASEALGDKALEQVTAPQGSLQRLVALQDMLEVVTDHEILHQQLGEAARAMK